MQNWDDIRYFLAVVRHGSLVSAAQDLGVDQSTVFRRLRSLETYLGTQVFDRRKHGRYELTAAGESLAAQARHIEAATFSIDREVRGQDLELSGRVRVTTAEDIAVVLLPRHLAEFQRRFPSISIELLTANRFFSLGRGEADVAIRPGESSQEDRVIPRRICATCFGLFASADYLAQSGEPLRRADLVGHRVIRWRGNLAGGDSDIATETDIEPDATQGSNSLMAQRAMAEAGMGIVLLPEFVGQSSAVLMQVLPEIRIDAGSIWLLHHDDLRRVARVRAFIDFMYQALQTDPLLNPDYEASAAATQA